jgi:hypothetical protein
MPGCGERPTNGLHQYALFIMINMVGVRLWFGVSMQGQTDLHIVDNGTLTTPLYVYEVLDV